MHAAFWTAGEVRPRSAAESVLVQVAVRLYALRFFCRCTGRMPQLVRLLGDCGGFLVGDLQCMIGRARACHELPQRTAPHHSSPGLTFVLLLARACHTPPPMPRPRAARRRRPPP